MQAGQVLDGTFECCAPDNIDMCGVCGGINSSCPFTVPLAVELQADWYQAELSAEENHQVLAPLKELDCFLELNWAAMV